MNRLVYLVVMVSVLIVACEKTDPVVAPNEELPILSYSESFLCQPLNYSDHIVSLTDRNGQALLCSYDEHGNKLWAKNIDQAMFPGYSFANVDYLGLEKTQNGNFLLKMFVPNVNRNNNQFFKAVGFDSNGSYQWQCADSIHQPDSIIIAPDTIDIVDKFEAAGMVHLSTGQNIALSYQVDKKIDSTYLQFSVYGNGGNFVRDRYYKIAGLRYINDVYLTSADQLLLFASDGSNTSYILMGLNGNIVFEHKTAATILNSYFFYETMQGNFIISASYLDASATFKGVVFCLNRGGNVIWTDDLQGPQATIMTSVQENTDSYLFSGFNTTTTLLTNIDWRTTFEFNKSEAVIQKVSTDGTEIWRYSVFGLDNTAGAASTGTDHVGFFLGKFQNSIKNVVLLKLDTEKGLILN